MSIFRCFLVILMCASALVAQEDPSGLDKAEKTLREGISTVALGLLEEFLAGNPSAADVRRARLLQGEALLREGREREAVDVLEKLGRMPVPEMENRRRLHLGNAFSELGKWNAALEQYEAVVPDSVAGLQARIGHASLLRQLGQNEKALEVLGDASSFSAILLRTEIHLESGTDAPDALEELNPTTAAETKALQYLLARVALEKGEASQADALFANVLADRTGLAYPLLLGAATGQARARMAIGAIDTAEQPLESVIDYFRNKRGIELLFQELANVHAAQKNPSDSKLREWAAESPGGLRRDLALLHLGWFRVRQDRHEDAVKLWEELTADASDSEPAMQAKLELAKAHLKGGRPGQALGTANLALKMDPPLPLKARLLFVSGQAQFMRGEYAQSTARFAAAAEADASLGEKARYNAALVTLASGEYEKFLESYKTFSADYPGSMLRQDLVLEEGILQLRNQDSRAAETLDVFVRDFPGHPRVADAWVARAEHAYAQGDLDRAEEFLGHADTLPATDTSRARADYLRIVLAEARSDSEPKFLLGMTRQWLEQYSYSPLRADVRMKLGELHYQMEDYLNAQTQFQNVASEFSGEPIQEKALFLAAMSAVRSRTDNAQDTGIAIFEAVYRMDGEMKMQARLEQAGLKARMGALEEALVLYDSILTLNPPQDLQMETLLGKAEALFNLATTEPGRFPEAVETFSRVANEPGVAAYWRNQALWKKGRTLEKMGRTEEALLAYHEVMDQAPSSNAAPEFFWSFKCGFDAGRLLEEDKKWKSAVALYGKLAGLAGPRSEEAARREQRLRLRHFLWSE